VVVVVVVVVVVAVAVVVVVVGMCSPVQDGESILSLGSGPVSVAVKRSGRGGSLVSVRGQKQIRRTQRIRLLSGWRQCFAQQGQLISKSIFIIRAITFQSWCVFWDTVYSLQVVNWTDTPMILLGCGDMATGASKIFGHDLDIWVT